MSSVLNWIKRPLYDSRFGPIAKELQRATWSRQRIIEDRDWRSMTVALSYFMREDACCVDVGAHNGEILALCRQLAPRGRFYAFEPIPELAESLRKRFPSVDVHELALAAETKETRFHHVVTNPGYSGLRRRRYPRGHERVELITVRTARLDDIVPIDQRVDFIKIDVEGAEMEVLRGAIRTLSRWRPYVMFEFGQGAADNYGTTPAMVHDFMRGCGLSVFTLDGRGPCSAAELQAIYEAGTCWNFLARAYSADYANTLLE